MVCLLENQHCFPKRGKFVHTKGKEKERLKMGFILFVLLFTGLCGWLDAKAHSAAGKGVK